MAEVTTAPPRAERPPAGARFQHLIDGQLVGSADGRVFETIDPHTGQPYGTAAEAGAEDVRRAVAAARRAFDEGPWPRMNTKERRALLNKLADRVHDETERLAVAESRDMGKPITNSRTFDLPRVSANLRFFADFQDQATAETLPMAGFHTYTRYDPVGVVAAISPWNFPLMLASWKIAPALAFGNTVVLKPAEQSPATASLFAELVAEVLPPGVLNVVHGFGPSAAGEFLARSEDVDLITFTGETRTGAAIMESAAPTVKALSLEMGGKSPNVVFADANLENALQTTVKAIFDNQGEVCLAGSRLFVERPIYDEFLQRLVGLVRELPVGDPMDPRTRVGPLVSEEQLQRVEGYLETARSEGAQFLVGGGRPSDPELGGGYYVEPTILDRLPFESRCVTEEIFGPVLVAQPFDTEEEAVRWANDTPYGLAGMVMTSNLARGHRVAGQIKAGTVWVNCYFVRDLRAPFGGAKRSGIGREGGYHSREFFTEAKTVTIDLGVE
ncbi:MAG: aldehyde dehydrogenase [Candidatus Dormibacteraeota bacterium]|nr:aldehyde dehydrogenase [Candidatus Dormibacteraeota bacterium]MBO0761209.1 aldehyde dehydrogenase [Candidatus Dormibacteraeota bacterium]